MPFYEYQCKNCGHNLEAMQKINDEPLKKCPNCGKSQLTRLMSAPVFRLKGGGWYETDFKGEQDHKKNLADAPESDGSSSDKKAAIDAKSDAKPADAKADTSAKGDKPAEKSADKPKEKAAAEPAKKAAPPISKRGASAAPVKSKAKAAAQKPPAKAKARR